MATATVEQVRVFINENNIALKAELDRERDSYALQNANANHSEPNALFEFTQSVVGQVAANHQSQFDHVNRVNVEQEVRLDAKHAEIAAITAQLGTQKTEPDSATELLRARDEVVRASMFSKQAEIATAFQNNNVALQHDSGRPRGVQEVPGGLEDGRDRRRAFPFTQGPQTAVFPRCWSTSWITGSRRCLTLAARFCGAVLWHKFPDDGLNLFEAHDRWSSSTILFHDIRQQTADFCRWSSTR